LGHCLLQALLDEIYVTLRRPYSRLRFLLEGMKHVDRGGERHGLDRAVSVTAFIDPNLKHACPAESFQRNCGQMLSSLLSQPKRMAHLISRIFGKLPKIIPTVSHEHDMPHA